MQYSQLPSTSKSKAIEKVRNSDGYLNHNWWEFVYDDWIEKLEKLGFEDIDIKFRGFWSQGDGCSFTAKRINICSLILNINIDKYKRLFDLYCGSCIDMYGSVERSSSYYCHENTVFLNIQWEDVEGQVCLNYFNIHDLFDSFEKEAGEYVKNLCCSIYKDLEQEYDDLMSDECIIDYIENNGYDYDIDGNII